MSKSAYCNYFDDTPVNRRSLHDKINDAKQQYFLRFGVNPCELFVNACELVERDDVKVTVHAGIRVHNVGLALPEGVKP